MKPGKCSNCGGNLMVDETKDAGICPYCGAAYVSEKAISNVQNTTNNAQVINNYYGTNAPLPQYTQPTTKQTQIMYGRIPPRPVLKTGWLILGLLFYITPGLIYLTCVLIAQKKWDKKYGAR